MNNKPIGADCQQATKHNPCPLCGKPDWCLINPDLTFVICGRTEQAPNGWKKLPQPASDDRSMFVWDFGEIKKLTLDSKKPKVKHNSLAVKLEKDENISLIKLKSHPNSCDTEVDNKWKKITYHYPDKNKVVRVEITDNARTKGYRKDIKPYWYDATAEAEGKNPYKLGKGNDLWMPYLFPDFWDKSDNGWILGVEGESCVEAAHELGVAAFTFDGSSWTDFSLTFGINFLKSTGIKGIVYYPDNDEAGYKKAERMRHAAAAAKVKFIQIDPTELWEECPDKGDIVDWIEWLKSNRKSLTYFKEKISLAIAQALAREVNDFHAPKAGTKLAQAFLSLREFMQHRLSYNTLTKGVELDGKPIDESQLRLMFSLEYGIDVPHKDAVSICHEIAHKNPYSPVKEYLEQVHSRYSPPPENFFETITEEFFGTSNPLHVQYFKRTLIAAVARTFEPGCKHDTGLILAGKQGTKKSTFWRVLASDEWFTDSVGGTRGLEDLRAINKFWICEIPEFESVHTKKDTEELKRFMSAQRDDIRQMYKESFAHNDRQCILVGTTNSSEFLKDSTGDRRFWVIPVSKKIPIEKVYEYRDYLWSVATHLYLHREQWWLTDEEDELRERDNEEYQNLDVWHELVAEYVSCRKRVTTKDVLLSCINILPSNLKNTDKKRVAGILRQIGWNERRVRESGANIRVWERSECTGSTGTVPAEFESAGTTEINALQDIQSICTGEPALSSEKLELNKPEWGRNEPPLESEKITDKGNSAGTAGSAGTHQSSSVSNSPPTSKFKVGDEVKYVGGRYKRQRNRIVIITLINKNGIWVRDRSGFPVGCCDENELMKPNDRVMGNDS